MNNQRWVLVSLSPYGGQRTDELHCSLVRQTGLNELTNSTPSVSYRHSRKPVRQFVNELVNEVNFDRA
jgi:hypothetical protein